MERREELETKGISQLMAERFAKGVPRGAYSNNSFKKAAQDYTAEEFSEDMPEIGKNLRMEEPGGVRFSVEDSFRDQGLPLDKLDENEDLKGYYDFLTDAYMNGTNPITGKKFLTFADFISEKKAKHLADKKMGLTKSPYRIMDD